ncbi:hypothetical protein WJX84_000534 [Apatococcus fuscideae]|uniref:Uncharacterized protein n=1 Tax=Apatococcus fuscideae TaxID=2026836 RepID=A0AAW1TD05_9CHLO
MSQHSYGNSYAQQKQRNRKLSILLTRAGPEQHSSGINKVVLGAPGHLFTASRDATIKRWQTDAVSARFEASLESHCDWVNDLALVDNLLFSCSADKTLKIWQADAAGVQQECSTTLLQHTDYVTALAAAPDVGVLASAGLRGEAFIWDVLSAGQGAGRGVQQVALGKRKAGNTPGSVYSLAMNVAGTVLAAGTAQHVIRICDARSGSKVMKLRGHTGNIRSVLLNAEGTMCISGAADRTIRVWDLGQQRCLHTLALHTDSVWTLAADPSFSTLLSGGRDGCVYRTLMATRLSELLLQEPEPIQSLAPDPASNSLWVATTSSSLHRWQLDAHSSPSSPSTQPRQFLAAHSALLRSRQAFGPSGAAFPEPQQPRPVAEIPGLPPLVRCASLLDRRHILAQDASGCVELWDIAHGTISESYGQVDFGQKLKDLFLPESVSPWFMLDCKLGSLMLGLEPPGCFGADLYAADLGITDPDNDQRFNYGEHLLRAALMFWSTRYNLRAAEKSRTMNVVQQHAGMASRLGSPLPSPAASVTDDGCGSLTSTPGASPDKAAPPLGPADTDLALEEAIAEQREALAKATDALVFTLPSHPTPVVICSQEAAARQPPHAAGRQGSPGQPHSPDLALPWRLQVSQFTGKEVLEAQIPLWAAQAVQGAGYSKPADSKCAFLLRPSEGHGLPAMLDARLTAPKVLRMHKVATYTLSKLQDQGISLCLLPVPLPPQAAIPADKPVLEIVCNGQAIPDHLTLAAIKTFVWKKSDDLVLFYRLRNSARPAPVAQIRPSS